MPFVPDTEERQNRTENPVLGPQKVTGRFIPDTEREALNSEDSSEPRRSLDWRSIGGAAMTGAAGGAATSVLTGTPEAMPAEATAGAVVGGAAELGGQIAEKHGASPKKAELIRAGVGFGAPVVGILGKVAAKSLDSATGHVVSSLWKSLGSFVGKDAEVSVANQTRLLQDALRGKELSSVPQEQAYALLNKGVEKEAANVQAQAHTIMAQAEAEAKKIQATRPEIAKDLLAKARVKAGQLLEESKKNSEGLKASIAKLQMQSEQITKENAGELEKIGTRTTPAGEKVSQETIGKELQAPITKGHEDALVKRATDYKKNEMARDEAIAAKYEKGQKISQTPLFKQLLSSLKSKLGDTGSGELSVTERSEVSDIKGIIDALEGREIETGKMTPGNYDQLHPETKKLPPDFEAIDTLRRKLGDVAYGKEVEGFKGISQARAKELYGKLNDIQGDFVGGDLQSNLQGEYSKLTNEINTKYKSGAGKKLTAVDRFSNELAIDPHDVTGAIFKTPQTVRDAVELTGDPKLVANNAAKYISMHIEGKPVAQVKAFLEKAGDSDWVKEVYAIDKKNGGNLQPRVEGYVQQLEAREAQTAKLTKSIETHRANMEKMGAISPETIKPGATPRTNAEMEAAAHVKTAAGKIESEFQNRQATAAKLMKDAEGNANKMIGDQQKEVADILSGENPHDKLANLIQSANVSKLQRASQWMGGTKEGKDVMADAVRQILSTKSAGPLEGAWNQKIKTALEQSGILDEKHIMSIDKDISEIMRLRKLPEADKRSMIKKVIFQSIGGYGSTIVGRAGAAGSRMVENIVGGKSKSAKERAEEAMQQ